MKKVDKRTRAARTGKEVYCPFCKGKLRLYYFGFEEITCLHCKKEVPKCELETD